jgi:hypothetical protein
VIFLKKKIISVATLGATIFFLTSCTFGIARSQPQVMTGNEMYALLSCTFPRAKILITHTEFVLLTPDELQSFISQDDTRTLPFSFSSSFRRAIHILDNFAEYLNWHTPAVGLMITRTGWKVVIVVWENQKKQIYQIDPYYRHFPQQIEKEIFVEEVIM